jgi:uncharacterized small protein (DUF1192 family)
MPTDAELTEVVNWVKKHKNQTHGNIPVIIGDQTRLLADVQKLQTDVAALQAAVAKLAADLHRK